MTKQYLRIGRIERPQGVRGELKLSLLTDRPALFDALECVYLETKGSFAAYEVLDAAVRGDSAYLTLVGVGDRNAAELFRGAYVCVPRTDAPLPEGRWFIDDLIGCAVEDSEGQALGKLREVLQHGAADVYVISGGQQGLMVPALKALLREVDVTEKRIVLDAELLKQVGLWEE